MHTSQLAHALNVLVVTEDRAQARQMSRFLNMLGHKIFEAAEPQSALAAVETGKPQVVILSATLAGRANWELCRLLCERQSPASFKFLMVEEPDDHQLQEALEAGVDDFLLLPLCYGELSSRLRAAARVLEYDRRAAQQGRTHEVTGLVSGAAFNRHLRQQWAAAGESARVACVVFDLDFFSRINQAHGAASGNTLLKAVTAELNNLRVGSEILGCLGADRFAAMLPGANDTAALEWAERARQVLAAMKFKVGKATHAITASFGVSSSDAADSPARLFEQATSALETAKSLGRNCVARWAEFGGSTQEVSAAARLFDRTAARHVMTPVSVSLRPGETIAQAVELFRRTRLDGIPVVDADGTLIGLCEKTKATPSGDSNGNAGSVGDVMTAEVKRFRPQDELATLMEFFNQDPLALGVVVDEGRAVGLVNCDSLLALSQPVSLASLAPEGAFADTCEYLVVPDGCPGEPATTATS